MVAKDRDDDNKRPRMRPATTPEGREQQLGSLAFDLAEKQLLDGTASAQVVTYFLKANSIREKKELARMEADNLLTQAKIVKEGGANKMEDLLEKALKAFTTYQTGEEEEEEEEDE